MWLKKDSDELIKSVSGIVERPPEQSFQILDCSRHRGTVRGTSQGLSSPPPTDNSGQPPGAAQRERGGTVELEMVS